VARASRLEFGLPKRAVSNYYVAAVAALVALKEEEEDSWR